MKLRITRTAKVMKPKKRRRLAKKFAMDQYLSEFPEGMSHQDILGELLNGTFADNGIKVWPLFDSVPTDDLVDCIIETRNRFLTYGDMILGEE